MQYDKIKQNEQLAGLMVYDDVGFQIYNNGFKAPEYLYRIFRLSQFFYGNQKDVTVGIETASTITIISNGQKSQVIAIKHKNYEENQIKKGEEL